MKPITLFLLIASRLYSQVWTMLPEFPGDARDDGASALVNNHAYFGTGLKQDYSSTTDWYDLDLSSLTWTTIPSMPPGTERQYGCAFAGINGFYVFGGDGAGGALNDLYRYDIVSRKWSKMTSRPGKGVIACACSVIAGKALVYGGKVTHDSIPSPEMWEYNLSNDTWTRKDNAPFGGRWRSAMTTLGAYVYVAGGAALPGGGLRRDLWSYDPGTGIWDSLIPVPSSVSVNYASLQAVGNKLVYFGGQDIYNNFYDNLWYYRVAQGDWQAGPQLQAGGRKGGMSVGWNEKFIYTCGLGPGNIRLKETWLLDIPLGILDASTGNFSVYPNPFEEEIHIRSKNEEHVTYRLCGSDGRLFMSGETENGILNINTSCLTQGLYSLHLKSEQNYQWIRKLIKN